jgi:hypothetical protein
METDETHVLLYVVELVYGNQSFAVTQRNNPRHLQLRTETPIWHKEAMVNLGVKKLLPPGWKAFAWIDADIEFESPTWAIDTLKILNGCKDTVQLFSTALDLSSNLKSNMNIFSSFGYSYTINKPYTKNESFHPGFAWAMTRKSYEKIGGLYETGVLGSGDHIMALSFINQVQRANNSQYHPDYNDSMVDFQQKTKKLRFGYIPGVIRHYYHGKKINRGYMTRWELLKKHQFTPKEHLVYDSQGLMVPSPTFPVGLKRDIMRYFQERKEDD